MPIQSRIDPLKPVAGAIIGVGAGTMISESIIMSPKAVGLFYVGIAKSCYTATGSKRIACGVAAVVCSGALLPGPQQGPFIVACAAISRGTNKM